MSTDRTRLKLTSAALLPFPANPEAQAAWQRAEDAYQSIDDVLGEIPWCSVGAPDSAALLNAAAGLIERAVELMRSVKDSREEDLRHRHWMRIHDSD